MVTEQSRTTNCHDNAMKESFFATLKAECVNQPFASRAAAREAICDFIEAWYNRLQLHFSLSYRSPASFDAQYEKPLL